MEREIESVRRILLAVTVIAVAVLMSGGTPAAAQEENCASESTTVTGVGTITDTACVEATRVRVWRVDFKGKPDEPAGNHEVVRDQKDPNAHQHIKDYSDGCVQTDAIEWKDCTPAFPDGTREKDWPVAYVKGSQVVLKEVRFKVTTPAGAQPLQNVTIIGTPNFFGAELVKFEKAGVNQVGDELVIQNVASNGTLDDFVDYMDNSVKMKIDWKVVDGTTTVNAGTSDHTLYVLYGAPRAGYEDKIYLTLVDYTTHGAVFDSTEADVVAGIWSEFPDREVRRRNLTPTTGAVDHSGDRMQYWGPNTGACAPASTEDLLKFPDGGRCDQWGPFLVHSLAIHGIVSESRRVDCDFSAEVPAVGPGDCYILVKNYGFGAAGAGNWPYPPAQVTELLGVPGQSNPDPHSNFNWHVIVQYGGKLYDPSYGTGPFNNLRAWEDGQLVPPLAGSLAGFQCGAFACAGDSRTNNAAAQETVSFPYP